MIRSMPKGGFMFKTSLWIFTVSIGLWISGCTQKQADPKPKKQADPKLEVQADPKLEEKIDPKPEKKADLKLEVQTDPKPKVQADSKSEMQADPKLVLLESICSDLQKKTDNKSICGDSELSIDLKKIDLKGKVTKQNAWLISSSRFQPSELIVELDLSDNPDLTSLPEFILDFPNLSYLDISNTKISDWSEEICQLKKLKKLIGTHNNYKNGEIPFPTFCIENLQILNMSHSNIKYIDEYIGKLQSLKELHLRNNQLFIAPLMIQQIPEISVVDFRNNFFKDEKINTLHDCNLVLPKEREKKREKKREKCKEKMLETMFCAFYYELPFLRGEPLRKMYTDLSGQDLDEFENIDAKIRINHDRCYAGWVGWMIDYEESPELLEKTIRGVTVRELRYSSNYLNEHRKFDFFFCPTTDWPVLEDDYEPKKMGAFSWEVVPEEWRQPGFATKFTTLWRGENYWIPQCPHLEGLEDNIKRMLKKYNIKTTF